MESTDGGKASDPVSLLGVLAAFVRRLGIIAATVFLFMLLGGYLVISSPFKADSSFVPSAASTSSIGGLGGLAAQLGVNVGDESIFYYAEIIRSRRLRRAVATTEYRIHRTEDGAPLTGTLVELLETEGESPQQRLNRTVGLLDDLITVGTAAEANLVRVTTLAPNPDLAVGMNARVLELINEFNLERKQQEAAAEESFLESRLVEAREELRAAEEEMAEFLNRNRSFETAPELQFEAARLERVISLREAVHNQLAQGLEQARLETARNTPVITALDLPEGSVRPARRLVPTLAIWSFMGVVFAVVIVGIQVFFEDQRRRDEAAYSDLLESVSGFIPRWSRR